jgi:hypothetical protein
MAPKARVQQGYARCRKIFSALDGRDFMAANEHWRLEVFSVVQQAANLWIQLRLVGDTPTVLTLRLAKNAGVRETLQTLADWLGRRQASPSSFSNVA